MYLLIICAVSIVIIVYTISAIKRLLQKRNIQELENKISKITPYYKKTGSNQFTNAQPDAPAFISIESDLKQSFTGRYITFKEKEDFINQYSNLYNEIRNILDEAENLDIEPLQKIVSFAQDFESLNNIIESHNCQIVQTELDSNKNFFDSCLKYPLDSQQRRSIVSLENNCLVISSAGSGKTSSIVGKVKYLINIKHVAPKNILLISYTKIGRAHV